MSILTNFEDFAVYDTRIPPKNTDTSATARIKIFSYKELPENWEYLTSIFTKEAIMKGSFDRYAIETKNKKGTAEVDEFFLIEIESWRDRLAHNIALRNEISVSELNRAVQTTIDRLIFLRICEDRGLETYGRLKTSLSGSNIYERLKEYFRLADEKYDSGLFHFYTEKGRKSTPDTLTLNLSIDDKVLKDIVNHIYYPESPYEFSVLPADILGQVYEQFLGRVISLSETGKAKVEDKPEVKKMGGVYYTPLPVVEYIVKNSLALLLEGKTPTEVSKIRILDPACGSGTFLIRAYQELLDWHLEYYRKDGPTKHKKEVVQGPNQNWYLTSDERKRILLSSIFGSDIDPQAVEVTKLSLLLKVLEQTPGDVIEKNQKLFNQRALPDIDNNIKCGNALIGLDFYSHDGVRELSDEAKAKINPFNWQDEFSLVFSEGGFDLVIGNPPWGASFSEEELSFLSSKFESAKGREVDSYALFIERAISLLKQGGVLGYITPDTFLRKDDRYPTRKILLEDMTILELIETGPVFPKVRDTWCLIFICKKGKERDNKIRHKKISRFITSVEERLFIFQRNQPMKRTRVPQKIWIDKQKMVIGYLATVDDQKLIDKIEKNPRLASLTDRYEISRGEEGSKLKLIEDQDSNFFMVIPENVERFYVDDGKKISESNLTESKLQRFYTHPKIWIIRIQKMRWIRRLVCGLDNRKNSAGMKTLQMIISIKNNEDDLFYLLGIINSSLVDYWCINYLSDDMNKSYLEKIPIIIPDSDKVAKNQSYRVIVDRVKEIQGLCKQHNNARTDHEQTIIKRQIEAIEGQIDVEVFRLYGLTNDEIELIKCVNKD